MREYLFEMLDSGGDLSMQTVIVRLIVATIIAGFIFVSYRLSHNGSIYSQKFNVSLAVLAIITATVMIVIGNNIALSLGMVGALSIVRFRTAIKDSRDTVYIFWSIVVGICCGAGDYLVAAVGSAFVFVVLLFLGRLRNDNRVLLILRAARINDEKYESVIFQYYAHKAILRSKNTTEDAVEYIYELNGKYLDRGGEPGKPTRSISDAIYAVGGVDYFNIVLQNDEIG